MRILSWRCLYRWGLLGWYIAFMEDKFKFCSARNDCWRCAYKEYRDRFDRVFGGWPFCFDPRWRWHCQAYVDPLHYLLMLISLNLLVWDIRSFRKPVATRSGITTLYPGTNAIFSPDEKFVVTGAGATTKGGKGKLLFLKRDTLETVKELEMDSTPVKVLWHPRINQVN